MRGDITSGSATAQGLAAFQELPWAPATTSEPEARVTTQQHSATASARAFRGSFTSVSTPVSGELETPGSTTLAAGRCQALHLPGRLGGWLLSLHGGVTGSIPVNAHTWVQSLPGAHPGGTRPMTLSPSPPSAFLSRINEVTSPGEDSRKKERSSESPTLIVFII